MYTLLEFMWPLSPRVRCPPCPQCRNIRCFWPAARRIIVALGEASAAVHDGGRAGGCISVPSVEGPRRRSPGPWSRAPQAASPCPLQDGAGQTFLFGSSLVVHRGSPASDGSTHNFSTLQRCENDLHSVEKLYFEFCVWILSWASGTILSCDAGRGGHSSCPARDR